MAEKDTTLYPPSQRVKSVVWKYFGYHKNADGSICDNGFPVCKKCGRPVAAQGRNTSNLFAHLRSNHPIQFRELRVSFLYVYFKLTLGDHLHCCRIVSNAAYFPLLFTMFPSLYFFHSVQGML